MPGANLQKLPPPPPPRLNRQPQESHKIPICFKFNSITGCHWTNCRYQHVCLVPNCHQGHPQHEHHTITTAWQPIVTPVFTSPLNHQAWTWNLEHDPDSDFLIDRLTKGFQIIPSNSVLQKTEISNYKSATASDLRDKVEKQIHEEIRNGNYVVTQAKPTIVSALGAILKPNTDKIRLIHDCSRPQLCHDATLFLRNCWTSSIES